LIFGSFDQAKERTREKNKAACHNTDFNRVFALSLFFFLDEKEPKNQERLIARPRTRSAPRSWAMILPAALAFGKKAAEMTKGFLQFSLYKPPTET